MRDIDEVLQALSRSEFRRSKKLGPKDAAYLRSKGIEKIAEHAADFIRKRLAPAEPANDGKQTPWRGHPVFTAQHATATCCRSCLQKWHRIEKGRPMTDEEIQYAATAIRRWLESQSD